MKLMITSIENGGLVHKEVELPERFLDLSLELGNGTIFQIDVSDNEDSLEIRETTYRKLSLEPKAANTITVKGI